MARYTYNGTDLDVAQNTTAITASTATLSVAGIFSTPFTAPNTTNDVTGVWVYFNSVPIVNDVVITLQESTVDKVSTTLVLADIVRGWNYVRFATPYQFTTTSANAYRFKAQNASNSGSLRIDGALFTYSVTIDTTIAVSSLAVGDDLWVGGIHDGTFTPQSLTLTGTSLSFGSGTDRIMSSTTTASVGAAITVGNGGTVKMDDTANCTVQIRGSVLVTGNGLFDKRGNSSDVTKVCKLIFDVDVTNGDYGLMTASGLYGGQVLTTGKTVDYRVLRGTGTGTTGDPWIPAAAIDSQVGDEVIFGGATDYLKNELKYIRVRNSSTSFTLCDTPGGAESGLAQTHSADSYVGLMTRNSIVTSLTSTRGYWVFNSVGTAAATSNFDYTRFEYNNIASGKSFNINTGGSAATFDGAVFFQSAAAGRQTVNIANALTVNNVIIYNQQGNNYSGQSGITASGSGTIFNNCLGFAAPSSVINTAFLSFLNVTNCTVNDSHAYGANATNTATGYAFGFYNAGGITLNNCSANGGRRQAILGSTAQNITYNNCNFGTQGDNTTDVSLISNSLNTMLFSNCNFGSTTLIDNYTNLLDGSEIAFQKINGSDTDHRWYTPYGRGRTETSTVRTGALSLAIEPEDATTGFTWSFQIPANANSLVYIPGFFRRSAGLTGDVTVDLYLPYSLTPDDTQTLSTTTGAWLTFLAQENYASSVNLLATVVVTVKGTAGNTLYLDDFFNSGNTSVVNNNIASFETWFNGKPAQIFSLLDVSALPLQTAQAVWSDDSTYTGNQKGKKLVDAADDADTAANK